MFARTRWAEAAYKLAGFEQNTLSLFPFPLTLAMSQMHSGICPPMPAWLLLPLSPQWADSVRCAGRWLTRKTWDYFCCHHTLFKNMFLPSQKATGECLQTSVGRQAPCPALSVSRPINEKVFLHRTDFTARCSCSYRQWARDCQNIFF